MGMVPRYRTRIEAQRAFRILCRELQKSLPKATFEHVGGTSVPGVHTKGDLDIQVRVRAEDFENCSRVLQSLYEPNHGGFWCTDGQSFKHKQGAMPVGLHLTVVGGSCDVQWKHRDALLASPQLRKELNAMKESAIGLPMDAYYRLKDEFFSKIAAAG